MPKLDLDDVNVSVIETSVVTIRSYFDGKDITEVLPDFETVLDNAQGMVHTGEQKCSYIVIKVEL